MVDTRFKKGIVPWNKGKKGLFSSWNKGVPMREESKRKLSESKKGKISPFKGKERPELAGKNHPMFGKHHSLESLQKMIESKKGKMVGQQNPFYGKTHSEETRRRLSEAGKGRPSWNKGKKTGKPAWNRGLSPSKETLKKQSEVQKRLYAQGRVHPMLGKPVTEERINKQRATLQITFSNPEVRKKMSESQKRVWTPEKRKQQSESLKGKYVGKNNPSYGRKHSEELKKAHSQYMKEYFKTHKHPMTGKKLSKEQIERLRSYSLGRPSPMKGIKMPERSEWGRQNILKQYQSGTFPKQTDTVPERKVREELIKRGYVQGTDFVHQYKFMNKFMCDFCFPKQKVIVEVYGDFWHANPNRYPEGTVLHPHQIKGKRVDKSKEAYITKVDNSSWTYIAIWESDIKKNVGECVDKVVKVLNLKNNN